MSLRTVLFIVAIYFICLPEVVLSQQRIKDFYLSTQKKTDGDAWEVKGKEAVVSDGSIEIEEMEGKYFQKDDTIKVKADKATMDKGKNDVRLEKNVVVENQKGMKLNTEKLKWERDKNRIYTEEPVYIEKENTMKLEAKGMQADTSLKKVKFPEEVKLDVKEERGPIKVTCDGPVEINYEKGEAVFNKNVIVDNPEGKMMAETAVVYFDKTTNRIDKIVAKGDVRIIRDDNVTFAEKATYVDSEKRLVLEGRPRLVIFPQSTSGPFKNKK